MFQAFGKPLEQFGVRRRVVGMVHVQRMHESPAKHHSPDPVGDVAGEPSRLAPREELGQPGSAAV
ncbi:MAG: hypothetical protein CMJ64_12445 [Planctomycetaceae bacterium]|nr:hypothetical protein [Planctomycetaceae bacterium]